MFSIEGMRCRTNLPLSCLTKVEGPDGRGVDLFAGRCGAMSSSMGLLSADISGVRRLGTSMSRGSRSLLQGRGSAGEQVGVELGVASARPASHALRVLLPCRLMTSGALLAFFFFSTFAARVAGGDFSCLSRIVNFTTYRRREGRVVLSEWSGACCESVSTQNVRA